MAKKKVSEEMGAAQVLDEAADIKLKAARKMAQADALLGEGDVPAEGEAQFEPLPEPPTKLESIISELGGEGKFEVYKLVAGTPSKVGTFNVELWPEAMEGIARKHGGGDYLVKFKDKHGRWAGQDTQSYDPEAYGHKTSPEAPAPDRAAPIYDKLFEMLREEKSALQLELAAMRRDQAAMMLEIVKGKNSGPDHSMSPLEIMKLAKEFSPPPPPSPLDSIKDILEVISVLKTDGTVGEPPSPLQMAIDKASVMLMPVFTALAAKLTQGNAAPAQSPTVPAVAAEPRPALPPAAASGNPPAVRAVPAPAPAPVDPNVAAYAQALYLTVQQGTTPEQAGDFLMSAIPDEPKAIDAFSAMIEDPGMTGALITAEPRLVAHQSWLARLVAYLTEKWFDAAPDAEAVVSAEEHKNGTVPLPVAQAALREGENA